MRSFFLLSLGLLLYGCSIPSGPLEGQPWITHICPQGANDYKPGHQLAQQNAGAGYDFSFVILGNDWYDPDLLGEEAKDWLKAGGVSYYGTARPGTYAKNHLSALVAFRMVKDRKFEVCAYVNDVRGDFRFDGVRAVPVGDTVHVKYRLRDDQAVFVLTHRGKSITSTFKDFESAGRQVSVGPWHGGSVPAPVPTGMRTRISWIK